MSETTTETPEAWVGCLGCYNAGALVGRWVDGTEAGEVTVESLHTEGNQGGVTTADIFRADPYASTHEELWVMDFQGYDGLLTGECSPRKAQEVAEVIAAIQDDGQYPLGAVAAWLANSGYSASDWGEQASSFEDEYAGEWSSEQEFAENLAEDLGAIDENATWPNSYIDWERAARDLFMGDYWSAEAPGGVWVFRS